jgi:hypothetical protein
MISDSEELDAHAIVWSPLWLMFQISVPTPLPCKAAVVAKRPILTAGKEQIAFHEKYCVFVAC